MDGLQELKEDLKVLKDYYRNIRQDTQGMEQKLSKLAGANTELGVLRQENRELRQVNGELGRKIASLQASSIEFYHLMERTLSLSDLNEEYRRATEKFLSNFERYLSPHYGVTRIVPLPGEPFQDEFHQAVGDEPISSVTRELISRCTGWGFKVANWEDPKVPETVKPAQVVITSLPVNAPEIAPTNVVETKATLLNVVQSNPQQADLETKTEEEYSKTEASQVKTDSKRGEGTSPTDSLPPSQENDKPEADGDILQGEAHPTESSTASTGDNPLNDKGS